jgi:hypothetical protein
MEQSSEQKAEQPWWQFRRGVSGNPEGLRLVVRRIEAEVAALTQAFAAAHGRAPNHVEAVTLTNAARLVQRLRRPLSAEDLVKLSGEVRRLLKSLGLDRPPSGPRHAPRASYADRLARQIADEAVP